MSTKEENIRLKFLNIEQELNNFFIERDEPIHGLLVGLLSKTNLLFLGSPGTAKSMLIKEMAKHVVSVKYFEWLLTRFSTPDELFGPISAKGLKEDHYTRIVDGKLPEAHFVFLDEIFKANSGILNCLLPLTNERIFYNDGKAVFIPLLCLVGASNEIPDEDEGLGALYDRFSLKYQIKPIVEETNFLKMLELVDSEPQTTISIEELTFAQRNVSEVEMSKGMYEMFSKIRNTLRKEGISVTDRTYKLATKIVRAEAWLDGCTKVGEAHLELLKHLFWQNPDKIKIVQSHILALTNPERNKVEEIYNCCLQLVDDLEHLDTAEKRRSQGIDAVAKLNTARKNIQTLIKTITKKGKDPSKEKLKLTQVTTMVTDIANKHINMHIDLKQILDDE